MSQREPISRVTAKVDEDEPSLRMVWRLLKGRR